MRKFFEEHWDRLKEPILELSAHFVLSLFAIAAVWLTEAALRSMHLDARKLPFLGVSLDE